MNAYIPAMEARKAHRVIVGQIAAINPSLADHLNTMLSMRFEAFLDAPTMKNSAAYLDAVIVARREKVK